MFKISILPNYRVKYYDYIVKWCSGMKCNWCVMCIAVYWLNFSFNIIIRSILIHLQDKTSDAHKCSLVYQVEWSIVNVQSTTHRVRTGRRKSWMFLNLIFPFEYPRMFLNFIECSWMFLNTVTVKTKIFPLFISQIPRVNLAEVGSNTVRDVKQCILLVDLGGMLWL